MTSEANDYAQIFNTISLKHSTNEKKTLMPAHSFWFVYIQLQNNSSLTPSFPFPKLKIDYILWKHAFKAKRIAALVPVWPYVRQDIFPFRVALSSYNYP